MDYDKNMKLLKITLNASPEKLRIWSCDCLEMMERFAKYQEEILQIRKDHELSLRTNNRSSPTLLTLTVPLKVGLVLVPPMYFCFVGLPFFPSASWPLSFLPLFFLFLRPCLIHARIPDWGRAFVHGHTFLHSWSGPMTVVIGLLHGATILSNLPLLLFESFIGP